MKRREEEREEVGIKRWREGRKEGEFVRARERKQRKFIPISSSHRARDDLRCQFSPDPKEEIAAHLAGYGTIRSGKHHS